MGRERAKLAFAFPPGCATERAAVRRDSHNVNGTLDKGAFESLNSRINWRALPATRTTMLDDLSWPEAAIVRSPSDRPD
jgi:hypothetical protein